jgi:hypothetical protein
MQRFTTKEDQQAIVFQRAHKNHKTTEINFQTCNRPINAQVNTKISIENIIFSYQSST